MSYKAIAVHKGEYDSLQHHGIRGMKWGVRRYQNEDGSLTAAGKARYSDSGNGSGFNTKRSGSDRIGASSDIRKGSSSKGLRLDPNSRMSLSAQAQKNVGTGSLSRQGADYVYFKFDKVHTRSSDMTRAVENEARAAAQAYREYANTLDDPNATDEDREQAKKEAQEAMAIAEATRQAAQAKGMENVREVYDGAFDSAMKGFMADQETQEKRKPKPKSGRKEGPKGNFTGYGD